MYMYRCWKNVSTLAPSEESSKNIGKGAGLPAVIAYNVNGGIRFFSLFVLILIF